HRMQKHPLRRGCFCFDRIRPCFVTHLTQARSPQAGGGKPSPPSPSPTLRERGNNTPPLAKGRERERSRRRAFLPQTHSYCRQAAGSLRSPADKSRRRTLPRASRTQFCAAAGREPVGASGFDDARYHSLKVVGGTCCA